MLKLRLGNLHVKTNNCCFFHISSLHMHDKSHGDIIYNRWNESAYFTFRYENRRTAMAVYLGKSVKNAKCVKYCADKYEFFRTFS